MCTKGNPFCSKAPEGEKHPISLLKEIKSKNRGAIIIGHLNINSLRNKFDALEVIIKNNRDIFVVTETKLNQSFPMGQFEIDGFSTPFRADRNKEGGGLLLYIRSDIPCKMLKTKLTKDIGFFIELKLRNRKWLLFSGYNPKKYL